MGEEGGSVGNLIKISKNIPTDAPLYHSVQCTTYLLPMHDDKELPDISARTEHQKPS